jgi:SWI/SNF-related matrix-associated actin-dependent regulator 1 of chromatin subfamily A
MLESVNKIVVFARHKDVIAAIENKFKNISVSVTGDTKIEDRQKNVEAFQKDNHIKLFIASIRAAGIGLTLTASSNVLFTELDWTPSIMCQAEDRCHRIGQKDSVLIQHLVFNDSLDVKMSKMLIHKQEIIDEAINKK